VVERIRHALANGFGSFVKSNVVRLGALFVVYQITCVVGPEMFYKALNANQQQHEMRHREIVDLCDRIAALTAAIAEKNK
jgi:hypothetical protein